MLLKIHASRLSRSNVRNLKQEALDVKLKFNPYTLRRLEQRDITKAEVLNTVKNGTLIEYHTLKEDRRILLRDVNGVCIVLNLDGGRIITAYRNNIDDNHKYINKKSYLFGV